MEKRDLNKMKVADSEHFKPGDTITVGRLIYKVSQILNRRRYVIKLESIAKPLIRKEISDEREPVIIAS